MNLSQILVVLLQSSVVLVAALVVTRLARRSAALRVAIGRVALLCVGCLVVLSPWLGERPAPVVPVRWNPRHVALPALAVSKAAGAKQALPATSRPESGPPAVAPRGISIDPEVVLVAVYAAGLAALLAYLGVGFFALAQVRRRSRPVVNVSHLRALQVASKQSGIRVPNLVEGADVRVPFVAGMFRPTIFLPAQLDSGMDEETVAVILRHEVAHIANGDLRWNFAQRLLCAVLWPQPFLWVLKRSAALAGEELCDAHVLASGVSGERYADCLLNVRKGLMGRSCPALAIGAVSSKSSLSKRVEAILDARRSRSVKVSRSVAAMTRVGALLVACSAVAVFARPTERPVQAGAEGYAFAAPYSGEARISDSNGRAVTGGHAWLVISGLKPLEVRTLNFSSSVVSWSAKDISANTAGTLVVRSPGHAVGFVRLWPAKERVSELQLTAGTTVRGQMTTEDGKPAAGVRVIPTQLVRETGSIETFTYAILPAELPLGLDSVTDASGKFAISDMPVGVTVAIDVRGSQYAQLRMADRLHAKAVAEEPKSIVLHPAARVEGVVTRNGKPVANIRVGAQGNHERNGASADTWREGFTDASGKYLIERLPAGSYNVAIDLPEAMQSEVTAVAHEAVTVHGGESVGHMDFALVPGAFIEGTVTNQAGQVMGNQPIGVYGPAHPSSSAWVQSVTTDKAGHFQFRVPAGKQYVYVMTEGLTDSSRTVTVEDGSSSIVDLQVRPAAIAAVAMAEDVSDKEQQEQKEGRQRDSEPTPAVMSFPGGGRPFYGPQRLKNGATVSIAYVQDDTTKAHTVWKADGGPATPADVASSLNMHTFAPDPHGARSMFVKVNVEGVKRGDFDCVVEVPQPSSWTVWQSYGDEDNRTGDLVTFMAAKTLQVTDLRLGLAAGPWRTVAQGALGTAPLFARRPSAKHRNTSDSAGLSLTVQIPAQVEGQDLMLVAFDRAGKELELESFEPDSHPDNLGNGRVRSYGYRASRATEIARVELRARNYEWTTFRGIHLYPR